MAVLSKNNILARRVFDSLEIKLRESILTNRIPFLGLQEHAELDEVQELFDQKKHSLSEFLTGLKKWPALFTLHLTKTLQKTYGEDGDHKVYELINGLFDEELAETEKTDLWKMFREACVRLGLQVSPRENGSQYRVEEYCLQTGISNHHLDDLTERLIDFIHKFGKPQSDAALKSWKNILLNHSLFKSWSKKRALESLRRDENCFYLESYLKILEGGVPTTEFEKKIEQSIENYKITKGSIYLNRSDVFTNISIILQNDEVGVLLPANSRSRWSIRFTDVYGEQHTQDFQFLDHVQFVPCPFKLPSQIIVQDQSRVGLNIPFELWHNDKNNQFLVFDKLNGSYKFCSSLSENDEKFIDPGEYIFLSRFSPDGFETEKIYDDPSLISFSKSLGAGEIFVLKKGHAVTTITARDKFSLDFKGRFWRSLEDEIIYSDNGLSIEFHIPQEHRDENDFYLRIYPSFDESCDQTIELDVNQEHGIKINLAGFIEQRYRGLIRLKLELRRKDLNRCLARNSTYVLMGLKSIKESGYIECAYKPNNFECDSENTVYDGESIQYKSKFARHFKTTFNMGNGRYVTLTWRVPGTFVCLEEHKNQQLQETLIPAGGSVTIRPDVFRYLKIYSENNGGMIRFGKMNKWKNCQRGYVRLPLHTLSEAMLPGDKTLYWNDVPLVTIEQHSAARTISEQKDKITFQFGTEYADITIHSHELLSGSTSTIRVNANDPQGVRTEHGNIKLFVTEEFSHEIYLPFSSWKKGVWLLRFETTTQGLKEGMICDSKHDLYSFCFIMQDDGLLGNASTAWKEIKNRECMEMVQIFERLYREILGCFAKSESQNNFKELWGKFIEYFSLPREEILDVLLKLARLEAPVNASPTWVPLVNLAAYLPWMYGFSAEKYKIKNMTDDFYWRTLCRLDDVSKIQTSNVFDFQICASFEFDKNKNLTLDFKKASGIVTQNILNEDRPLINFNQNPSESQILGPLHYRFSLRKCWQQFVETSKDEMNSLRRCRLLTLSEQFRKMKVLRNLAETYLKYPLDDVAFGNSASVLNWELGGHVSEENLIRRETFETIPSLISSYALFCRLQSRDEGAMPEFLSVVRKCDMGHNQYDKPAHDEIFILSYAMTLGQDLFVYFLLFWELVLQWTVDHKELKNEKSKHNGSQSISLG